MLNRSKLAAASLVLVTFVAGGVVGSVVSRAWDDDDGPRSEHGRGRDGDRERRPSYSERLGDALELSAAQRESVSVILKRRQEGLGHIWAETQPRFDSLRLEIRKDISGQLDSSQQATFQEMIARSDSARAARESRENDGRGSEGDHRYDR